jgi:Fe-S-cluster formation regulator IscX/YfhJ
MTKILLVGDYHVKPQMLSVVDKMANENEIDKIVWLGDYCDDWNKSGEQLTEALEQLLTWADKRGDVTLLWGNHDYRYMQSPPLMSGFGYSNAYAKDIKELFEKYAHLMEFAYHIDNWIFSHAGFTKRWLNFHFEKDVKPADIPAELDRLSQTQFGPSIIQSVGPARGGNRLPGPLWADWTELCFDHINGVNQVVGHSPRETTIKYDAEGIELWCADTWSTYSNDMPIGDGSMLLWNDGVVTKLETGGIE